MRRSKKHLRRAFSLIELVIVVVIIGIIAAIAIPRMSRGAEGASDAAVTGSLAVMRNAIDLFATEHEGVFPGNAAGETFEDQMTMYTNNLGATSATKNPGTGFIYGPYLRAMPKLPIGAHKGQTAVVAPAANPPVAEVAGSYGWLYDKTTGEIFANAVGYFDK